MEKGCQQFFSLKLMEMKRLEVHAPFSDFKPGAEEGFHPSAVEPASGLRSFWVKEMENLALRLQVLESNLNSNWRWIVEVRTL